MDNKDAKCKRDIPSDVLSVAPQTVQAEEWLNEDFDELASLKSTRCYTLSESSTDPSPPASPARGRAATECRTRRQYRREAPVDTSAQHRPQLNRRGNRNSTARHHSPPPKNSGGAGEYTHSRRRSHKSRRRLGRAHREKASSSSDRSDSASLSSSNGSEFEVATGNEIVTYMWRTTRQPFRPRPPLINEGRRRTEDRCRRGPISKIQKCVRNFFDDWF